MAQAYWQSGQTASATFSLFFRKYPPDRAYFVFAGLADVLDYVEGLHFSSADLEYLDSLGRFDRDFLEYRGNSGLPEASAACRKERSFSSMSPSSMSPDP